MSAIWFVFLCFVSAVTCYGPEPTLQCPYNEEAKCVDECPPERTCRNRMVQFNCATPQEPCTTKCVCKPGLYRNPVGDCIPEERCEQCTKPNEHYACSSACDNECSKLHYQNQTNCPIVNIKCNEWCYCDSGYARDGEGNCIPISECLLHCEDPNEEYAPCKPLCPPETCDSIVAFIVCPTEEACVPRCVCKPGHLRQNADAPCMPTRQCPQLANSPDFN